MTPTEHEGTVAVDAAARRYWESRKKELADHGAPNALPEFDDLEPLQQNGVREFVLPFVWAALEALPSRVDSLREEWGRRIKDDSEGNGHMIGFVPASYRTREDALEGGNGKGMFQDQELVKRRVTEWEAAE